MTWGSINMTMRRLRLAALVTAVLVVAPRAHGQATGAIAGTVFDSLRTYAPLRDATVMVTENGRTATTDARGRFRIDSMPAGTYRLTFFYAVLDSLGIGGPVTTVTVAGGLATEASLSTPTPTALYRRLCGPPKDQSVAAVVGRDFTFDLLERLSDVDADALLDAIAAYNPDSDRAFIQAAYDAAEAAHAGQKRDNGDDYITHPLAVTTILAGIGMTEPVLVADIPAGDYWVQPFVNVYSEFKRADGHTVWMHDDQWEGQNWTRSPGNIYGKPVKVHFDPKTKATVALVADQVIPPIAKIGRAHV